MAGDGGWLVANLALLEVPSHKSRTRRMEQSRASPVSSTQKSRTLGLPDNVFSGVTI
jgi:hypothetical protein